MTLPGAAAGAFGGDRNQLAARHRHAARALAKSFEVDRERPIAIQLTQSADAIADSRQQDSELRLLRALKFRGREEPHSQAANLGLREHIAADAAVPFPRPSSTSLVPPSLA